VRHRTSIWRQESIHLCEGGTAGEEVPQIRRGILPQGPQRRRRSSPAACLMGSRHQPRTERSLTRVPRPSRLRGARQTSITVVGAHPSCARSLMGAHHQPRAAALMGEVAHLCAAGRSCRACPPPRPSREPLQAPPPWLPGVSLQVCRILFFVWAS
jgi:hypothetical protein